MAKYKEIYKDLSAKVLSHDYPSGTYLPSENELMETYQSSRDTIRKALNLLLEKGLILKEKGKGSKVLDQDIISFSVSGIQSFREIADQSPSEIRTDVITVETGMHQTAQQELRLPDETPSTKVVRVRSFDGERIILDCDYLDAELVPGIDEAIAEDSLYRYIEQELGLPIGFAKKEITVEPATREQAALLDMNGYDLLVVVRSWTYLDNGSLFQYTESRHRPDKFKFEDFARREV